MTKELKARFAKLKERTKKVSDTSPYKGWRPPEVKIDDGHYQTLFMAKELDIIKMTLGYDGEVLYFGISVMDPTHFSLVSESGGSTIYHIHQFGEANVRCHNTVELVKEAV
jgi:hypothetical protein